MMIILTLLNDLWNLIKVEPIAFTLSVSAILYFVIQKIVEGRINHEYDKKLENYKFEIYRQEQAVKIASVFAEIFSDSKYSKINQLLWELSLWLPEDKYKQLCKAIKDRESSQFNNDNGKNISYDPRQLLIDIRKELKTPGNLSKEDILRFV